MLNDLLLRIRSLLRRKAVEDELEQSCASIASGSFRNTERPVSPKPKRCIVSGWNSVGSIK
jgi:hypothetical protein